MARKCVLFVCLSLWLASCQGYNILGVFMIPARSHYFVGSSLMQGLADAGHNVTMVTPYLAKNPVNYEQIFLEGAQELIASFTMNMFEMGHDPFYVKVGAIQGMGTVFTKFAIEHKNVVALLDSGRKFDVVIVEIFCSEAFIAFGRHFNAQAVVAVATFGATTWLDNLVGNTSPTSFVPNPLLSYTHQMNFFERMENLLLTAYEQLTLEYLHYPNQAAIVQKTFPKLNASFDEIRKNDIDLVLINSHFTLNFPRTHLPNMIEVGGMNINRKTTSLPEDLQMLLDKATQGVVYFSMGSNIRCQDMAAEKRDALIAVFRKLPHLVLWKWEADELPGKPDNVIIRPWYPQDAILAHPNVKLFITHGGLLSTTEAIYFGKPIIGIPIFGDQELNMKKASLAGYGVHLDYHKNFTESSLSWALHEVLTSKAISEKIALASAAYRNQPMTPVETAVFWVEYVARHRGAAHLQSHAKHLSFVQYHNLDVFAFLATVLAAIAVVIARVCCSKSRSSSTPDVRRGGATNNKKRKGD